MINSDEKPLVSVVMPVYNEEAFIENSLEALLAQTYPKDLMEIIVADGMSSDRTREIISRININSDIAIIIVDNPKRIAPTALNLAIARAKGEIIVRIDGHCEVAPDYVENCVKYLRAGKAECVGGPIETIGETVQAQGIAYAMSSAFGVGGSAFRTVDDREMYVDTVAFPGYKKETLRKIGGFNEELVRNQDDEFNYRLRKLGGRILLSPLIRSRYYSRSTFSSLWRQYFQYGYWKVRVLQLHPKQMSLRQFIPLAFVLSIIIFGLLGVFFSFGKWMLLLILASYLLANFAATMRAAAKLKFKALPFVSLSFVILHVSYGLGFIKGLISFRRRWNLPESNPASNIGP